MILRAVTRCLGVLACIVGGALILDLARMYIPVNLNFVDRASSLIVAKLKLEYYGIESVSIALWSALLGLVWGFLSALFGGGRRSADKAKGQ